MARRRPLHGTATWQQLRRHQDPNAVDLRSDSAGANVFVLFDTSNYMYRGFVYASDAIADFIRGLDRADSVAVYTYSRNLNRAVSLNRDRTSAISGLRKAVAGDDSALYNCLLLTLRDAAKVPGRKVVIVFSNGPDNASMVAPDDVRAVAEDEGIPIYVISTNEINKDPISSTIFKRISTNTGGKSYFAKTWQKQVEAFESIREDLGNSYVITYYPQPNPNEGFRRIRVELTDESDEEVQGTRAPRISPATRNLGVSLPDWSCGNVRFALASRTSCFSASEPLASASIICTTSPWSAIHRNSIQFEEDRAKHPGRSLVAIDERMISCNSGGIGCRKIRKVWLLE